jgi:quinol monooxygenase YgiN
MEVRLVVTIAAVPGKGLELAQAFSRRAVDTRKEDGCNQFEAFVSADDPDRVVILERWRDQAALDAHAQLLKTHYPPLVPELRASLAREDYAYKRTK